MADLGKAFLTIHDDFVDHQIKRNSVLHGIMMNTAVDLHKIGVESYYYLHENKRVHINLKQSDDLKIIDINNGLFIDYIIPSSFRVYLTF